ncbi:hypothetical protein TWF481_003226 [Arthrobotrys musiformis]|uniref:Clr5 domain-containing protein n=1 Tax=Arthrobotrys musiformis TaxID=47236 RepID=A0AAV9VPL7_9PEZI
MSQPQTRKRKRAPRCAELDDDDIKEEMRMLYQLVSLSHQEIAEEINRNYNLAVTHYQVRDKLNKLGYKKRLSRREAGPIYRQIVEREKMNKESDVIIGGVITLSGKRLKRSMNRNLTLTEQQHILNGIITTELPGSIQVCTPQNSDMAMDLDLPRCPKYRYIPLQVLYSLPIWQFSCLVDKITLRPLEAPNRNDLKITAYQSIPHIPLLRFIIYQISNNHINLEYFAYEINHLLDQVNRLGLRGPLKKILSHTSASVVAVCEIITPLLYAREDFELLEFICHAHPKVKLPRLYEILEEFWEEQRLFSLPLGYGWVETALAQIEKKSILPDSLEELCLLLEICKFVRKDISLFLQIWDKTDSPEFVGWCGRYSRRYISSDTPLMTECKEQLEVLLSRGFTGLKWALTLRAVLLDNYEVTRTFLQHSDLHSDLISMSEKTTNGKHVWEMLEIPVFHQIVVRFVELDMDPEFRNRAPGSNKWRRVKSPPEIGLKDDINQTLVWVACLNPEMTDYTLHAMKWANPSLTGAEVVALLANLLLRWPQFGRDYESIPVSRILRLEFGHRETKFDSNFNPPRALEGVLQLGTEQARMELWQGFIWEYLDDWKYYYLNKPCDCEDICYWRDGRVYQGILDLFRALCQSPEVIESDLELRCESLYSRYTEVYGSGSQGFVTPILVALLLKKPDAFLVLLESGARTTPIDIDLRPAPVTTTTRIPPPMQKTFVIDKSFIQACHRRDLQRIRDLWDGRLETVYEALTHPDLSETDRVKIHLQRADFATATEVSLKSKNSFLRLQDTKPTSSEVWSLSRDYRDALSYAIKSDAIGLLDVLLKCKEQLDIQDYGNSLEPPDPNWLLRGSKHMGEAAQYSLRCLKSLLKHGFDINQAPYESSDHYTLLKRKSGRTALSGALRSDDIATLVFVLQNGADIYAPTGDEPSAIASAVYWGRIDAVALMLAVDPNCHHLALEAAETTRYNYIKDYVRNWKPGLNSVVSDQSSLLDNVSKYLPVAIPADSADI